MSRNKSSYFQGGGGVNEPSPKKKKYKSDPAPRVQTRFKEPLYRNYDLYDVPGKHGPGAGWHSMQNYKSIQEFLKAKRKKLKGKYKATARLALLNKIIKKACPDDNDIDFPLDNQINTELAGPMGEVCQDDNPAGQANLIGGYLDEYLPEDDFEGKLPTTLDFGRDYSSDEPVSLDKLIEKYLEPAESNLLGLPDGISPISDLDADQTVTDKNPYAGINDTGRQMYEDKWNI